MSSLIISRISGFRHFLVMTLKRAIWGKTGEPYEIPGHMLRYEPRSRPIRAKYATSGNNNARYDALQVRLFSSELSEGDVAIDVGAHAGQYSLIMAALCGSSGRVIAFEPDPYARQLLERNLALNPKIKRPTIEIAALSDVSGEAIFYSKGGNTQSSLARSGLGAGAADADVEEIRVPTMRLDDYVSNNNIPVPRWIKIDAEGAEIRILQGMKDLLCTNAGVVCELHPYAWAEFGTTMADLRRLADAANRRIRYMDRDDEVENPVYGTVFLELLA
jgi:FkbM family methyltransferase